MNIIGAPSATFSTVVAKLATVAPGRDPRFVGEMITPLWNAAEKYCIDAVGMVAQCGKETGWGTYKGNVRPTFCNPCGLKTRYGGQFPGIDDGDNPLAHERFASWNVGMEAFAQHLRAYAGIPVKDLIVDPRYTLVIGRYQARNFADLSGKWAPSLTYGQEIEAIAARLIG